jgi:hypothetical protein
MVIGEALLVEDGDDLAIGEDARCDLVHAMRVVLEDGVVGDVLDLAHQRVTLSRSAPAAQRTSVTVEAATPVRS